MCTKYPYTDTEHYTEQSSSSIFPVSIVASAPTVLFVSVCNIFFFFPSDEVIMLANSYTCAFQLSSSGCLCATFSIYLMLFYCRLYCAGAYFNKVRLTEFDDSLKTYSYGT